jgi:hypothetical protein
VANYDSSPYSSAGPTAALGGPGKPILRGARHRLTIPGSRPQYISERELHGAFSYRACSRCGGPDIEQSTVNRIGDAALSCRVECVPCSACGPAASYPSVPAVMVVERPRSRRCPLSLRCRSGSGPGRSHPIVGHRCFGCRTAMSRRSQCHNAPREYGSCAERRHRS